MFATKATFKMDHIAVSHLIPMYSNLRIHTYTLDRICVVFSNMNSNVTNDLNKGAHEMHGQMHPKLMSCN